MTTRGTVRFWRGEDGWGVIDSPETPGGCWTSFGHVVAQGYAELVAGQEMELEWEVPGQDGYDFRAVRSWPVGQDPVGPTHQSSGAAYRSRLTITWHRDDPT